MSEYKYIKCFSKEKANELIKDGYEFLYDKNAVWYFENNKIKSKKIKFSKSENFSENDIVLCKSLNF